MNISPLFEFMAYLAISAFAFTPLVDNFIYEQQRSQAEALKSTLSVVAEKARNWCDQNNNSCTGITIAALQTANLISAAQATQFTAALTIAADTDPSGGTNAFKESGKATFMKNVLSNVVDSTGSPASSTNTALCWDPNVGGVYSAATAGGC